MDRRKLFGFAVAALAAGAVSVLGGCSKTENVPKLGNQDKLWKMTAASEKLAEPVDRVVQPPQQRAEHDQRAQGSV